jgi:hypothetical protein
MTAAWCPRCQRQVRVRAREVKDEQKGEVRRETLCAECGILLKAETRKTVTSDSP